MKKNIVSFLLLFLPVLAFAQDDLAIVKSKLLSQIYGKVNEAQIAKSMIAQSKMNVDGSWADINYDNKEIGNWDPIKHLDRIQSMAIAFTDAKSVYLNNKDIYLHITKALQFWYEKNPRSSNWWHNDIATPQALGKILLLMDNAKEKLPEDLQKGLLDRMAKTQAPFTFTGANKLDIAIHYIYRALITKNVKLMNIGVLEAFQPVELTTGEGLQYDYSFQQHKEQLMIASYGLVFITGEYEVASWLSGTKYAIPENKLQLLNHYFFSSFVNALRGGFSDYNIEGRGVSRLNILDRRNLGSNKPGGLLSQIATVSPEKAGALNIVSERISGKKPPDYEVQPLHNYFWKGDYTLHVRPKYSFNVRTVSNRTIRTETGNKENMLGTVLPDGSVNLVRRGDEYFNIMPAWEWDKIPGVTARDYDTAVTMKKAWGEYGSTAFVGGVSDGMYGATVYDQNYDGVTAKKGYFFFDDEVVCLGAGIHSDAPQDITTTVNQAWSNGQILVKENNTTSPLKKKTNFEKAQWVWHDSIGYVFPSAQNIIVSNDIQKGDWKKININSKGEVKGNVFKLWMNHGKAPVAAAYAYITVPGVSETQLTKYDQNNIQIISNTQHLQAVANKPLKIVQAIFYKAGELMWNGWNIKADAPCILQVREMSDGVAKLSIADPAQQHKKMNISIGSSKTKEQHIEITLPQAPYQGQTVTVEVK